MIRPATQEDMLRIRELHSAIERKLGKAMDLPEVAIEIDGKPEPNPAILGYFVVVIDGTVEQFFYFEKCIEFCSGGFHAEAFHETKKFLDAVMPLLLSSHARVMHCHVPEQFSDISNHVRHVGFDETGYRHFMLGLEVKP